MRGRRAVIVLLILIFQFLTFSPKISAEPSQLWKEAIGQYSTVTVETQNPEILKPVRVSILSKGLLDEIIPDQKLKIQVFRNNSVTEEKELVSRPDGTAGFAFVPKEYAMYIVHIENTTYEKPISLNPVSVLIQKNQSLFDLILRRFF